MAGARPNLARLRSASQLLSTARESRRTRNPADVVRWMTAMQAQDFLAAKWAVGLRSPGSTDAAVEASLVDGSVVRSWPLRGTLHFVAAEDLSWMLSLTSERMIKRSASVFTGEGLTAKVLSRAADAAGDVLNGGGVITRDELYSILATCGVSTVGQARYHALWYLCQIGVLCLGPPRGRTQTFVLLDEWVRHPRRLERDEALGELALRYASSHGPASVRDFSWWSSLTLTEARTAFAIARPHLGTLMIDDVEYFSAPDLPQSLRAPGVQLLPGFDEFLIGYSDRSPSLSAEHASKVMPGKNGMFLYTILAEGRVVGTWKRTTASTGVAIALTPFARLAPRTATAVNVAAARYADFLGLTLRMDA